MSKPRQQWMSPEALRAWRLERGWQPWKAAQYLGTTQATISRWETGDRHIPRSIAVLAHLLTYEHNIPRVEKFSDALRKNLLDID